MAVNVSKAHAKWLATPGKNKRLHQDNKVRVVDLPPHKSICGWDVSVYRNRWDLIDEVLKAGT